MAIEVNATQDLVYSTLPTVDSVCLQSQGITTNFTYPQRTLWAHTAGAARQAHNRSIHWAWVAHHNRHAHDRLNVPVPGLLVTVPDLWSKSCKFESQRKLRENFLLHTRRCVLILIRWPFHPHVTAVAWKRLGHSAESAGGRLHLNMHKPLTQWSWSGLTYRCPGIVWEPIRKLAHTQHIRDHSVTVISAR